MTLHVGSCILLMLDTCPPIPPPPPTPTQAILSWTDPFSTTLALAVLTVISSLILLLGFRPVIAFGMCWILRHPRLRDPVLPPPAAYFLRLPARRDRIM
jgi:hypothetical protein